MTVGSESAKLLTHSPESRDPIELEREMQKEYLDNLIECINANKDKFKDFFYVIVLTKNEKLLPNVFRNYFYARNSCPTPDYDQSVYRYNKSLELLEYIWTIPSQDTCHYLRNNSGIIDKSEHGLLNFVLDFADGKLYTLAKKLNGEELLSPLLKEAHV